MYQYSGQNKDGFHHATLEETLAVINQACGTNLHVNTITPLIDSPSPRSQTSLPAEMVAPMLSLLRGLGINPITANVYFIGHAEGSIQVQPYPGQVVTLKYFTAKTPANIYVAEVSSDVPVKQSLVVPQALWDAFLNLIDAEQLEEVQKQLEDYDLTIV